jgi:hypothetical protein
MVRLHRTAARPGCEYTLSDMARGRFFFAVAQGVLVGLAL